MPAAATTTLERAKSSDVNWDAQSRVEGAMKCADNEGESAIVSCGAPRHHQTHTDRRASEYSALRAQSDTAGAKSFSPTKNRIEGKCTRRQS